MFDTLFHNALTWKDWRLCFNMQKGCLQQGRSVSEDIECHPEVLDKSIVLRYFMISHLQILMHVVKIVGSIHFLE